MARLSVILLVISWLLIIAVALPLVRSDYWIFRIFEYPRFQKLMLCSIALAGLIFAIDYAKSFQLVTMILLGCCVLFLSYKIWPYTPFSNKEMKDLKNGEVKNQIKIYTANVFQPNTEYNKIIEQIKQYSPDVVMLMETDKKWEIAMEVLLKDYPYCLKEPLDNMYGILFYSRLEMVNGSIQYIVESDIPSIEATVKLPSGQQVKIWGLHPKPPVPGEEEKSTAKDMEIMKVAFKVRDETLPTIVMGDLNDVAWSRLTKLFRKTSGLLDPRRGRGFYSTFNAKHWYIRFPLDYVFCSNHFGLIQLKRLEFNGSDHFPMYSHFEFKPGLTEVQEKPKADKEDLKAGAEEAKGN